MPMPKLIIGKYYYEPDPQLTVKQRVTNAAHEYFKKYKVWPNLAHLNPSHLEEPTTVMVGKWEVEVIPEFIIGKNITFIGLAGTSKPPNKLSKEFLDEHRDFINAMGAEEELTADEKNAPILEELGFIPPEPEKVPGTKFTKSKMKSLNRKARKLTREILADVKGTPEYDERYDAVRDEQLEILMDEERANDS